MIYTLTPNPSIDRSLTLPEIRFNTVLRSQQVRLDWGGKGFNVSRALAKFGIESTAMAWVGGGTGKMLADGLQRLGIATDFVWVEEETRTNTMIIEEQGDWHIKVNEPGPPISQQDVEQLISKAESYVKKGDLWILSGSLPPDVPVDFYAQLTTLLKSRGAKVYLDSNGDPLRLGCQAGPYLVKPNAFEASHIVGFDINDQEDAKRAALPFLRMGVEFFGLTMGSSGLLLATQREMVFRVSSQDGCAQRSRFRGYGDGGYHLCANAGDVAGGSGPLGSCDGGSIGGDGRCERIYHQTRPGIARRC